MRRRFGDRQSVPRRPRSGEQRQRRGPARRRRRREINWDGGGSTATSLVPTPFEGFLVNRGALFTTPGTGFVQAPVDGLVTTFGDPVVRDRFPGVQPGAPVPRRLKATSRSWTSSFPAAATSRR